MSEEEKQEALLIYREILRQAKPQLDTSSLQASYDDLMSKISTDSTRGHMLPIATQILDVITTWREKLSRIERSLEHIERTPAAELSHDSIRAASN
jgi:hypothetical protein